MSKKIIRLCVIVCLLLVVVGCSSEPEEIAQRSQEIAVDLEQEQESEAAPAVTDDPTHKPLPTYTPQPTYTPLPTDTPEVHLSQPGIYQGYSLPLYQESTSTSQYITMRDGTKLAALILRPAQDGKPVSTPLPVIWTHARYHREGILHWQGPGDERPYLETVLQYGYVIVSVDIRGTGASFGTFQDLFTPEDTSDAYDITEWLAVQPWSDGNIGMYGRSYMGITQFMAASAAPPHLKAIFPEMAEFDRYTFVSPGGVFHNDFFRQWGRNINELDASGLAVDDDTDQAMLQDALKQHEANTDVFDQYSQLPYRDSVSPLTGTQPYITNNPATYL